MPYFSNLNMENMKRKKLCIILFVVLVSTFLYTNSYLIKRDVSNLIKENVEALAVEEFENDTECQGRGTIDCPINNVKVDYVYEGYSLRY